MTLYTFAVTRVPTCERHTGGPDGGCDRPAAYRLVNVADGRVTWLCERDLEPWLEERRWAALRMGYPHATGAEVEALYPEVVRVVEASR